MRIFYFTTRLSLALLLIAYQAYEAYKYAYSIDTSSVMIALAYQCGLQFAVTIIAPIELRIVGSILAAWASALIAAGVVLTWVTVVVPFAGLMQYSTHGDFTILKNLLLMTVYPVVPFLIVLTAPLLDEVEGSWDF